MKRILLVLNAALGTNPDTTLPSQGACPPVLNTYAVTFQSGLTYFANHFANPPLNFSTLATPPGPLTVNKYNGIGFDTYTYDPDLGGWMPFAPTVNSGEGVVVDNPGAPFVVNPTGTPSPVAPLFLPAGIYLRGAQRVDRGTFESMLGRPPGAYTAAAVYRYNPAGPVSFLNYGYDVYHFTAGKWSPSAPILDVGEAAFIRLVGTDNGNLLTAFSANGVSPATGSDGNPAFLLRITGTGFTATDTITLQQVSGPGFLTSLPTVVDPCGFYTETVLNLTSLAGNNGYYHVSVTQGANTVTVLAGLFLQPAAAQLTVSIIGQNVMGVGMVGNYGLKVKNVGGTTANGIGIRMDGTAPTGLAYGGTTVPASTPLPAGAGFQDSGISLVPGASVTYTFAITPDPGLLNQTAVIKGKVTAPVSQITEISFPILVLASADPNDKFGPPGVGGAGHYVDGLSPFDYGITFENKPSASAPARDVVITDQLDTTRLDLNTFELGPIFFGPKVVLPPPGSQTFSADVAYDVDGDPNTAVDNIVVRITATLDTFVNSATFGQVEWKFRSLDPNSLQPVQNVFSGFLPANQTAPQGQGSVMFTVQPYGNLPSGDVVANGATIVFDANQPILTPVWINTIDKAEPGSQVQPLAPSQASPSFTVDWSGSDAESGIAGYDVFVSDNNGPYTPWLVDVTFNSASYAGQAGHTYRFYSVATDLLGLVEAAPSSPDATTTVSTPPPVLQIVATAGGVQLLWDDPAFSLESSPLFGAGAVWTPLAGASGLTLPAANGSQFFRLIRP